MISIIIPTYNHPKLLSRCLLAIRRQVYKDYEIIVVNDGSDVDLNKVIKKFPEVKYFSQDHLGAPIARNKGFAMSQGEYVIFLDDDVIMFSEMLLKMKEVLDTHLNISYVYCSYRLGWKKITSQNFSEKKLQQINYIHTSSLIRRDDFFGFDETLKKFQDWDLWLSMLKQGKKGYALKNEYYKIIKPRQGHISTWLPSFMYKLPWPILGWTPKVIVDYNKNLKIIKNKHQLFND